VRRSNGFVPRVDGHHLISKSMRTGSLILTFGRLESSLWVPEVDVND
jgi:hypothetical protein